jgi:hypothetical protein
MIPSYEYATELLPTPDATHILPFHETLTHIVKIFNPKPFHVYPSYE